MEGSEEDFTSLGAGGGLTSKSLSGLEAYESLFSVLDDIENKKSSERGSGRCSRQVAILSTSAILCQRPIGWVMEWGENNE